MFYYSIVFYCLGKVSDTMQIGHSLFLTSPFLNFTITITFSHSSNDQIFFLLILIGIESNFSNNRKYYLVKNILFISLTYISIYSFFYFLIIFNFFLICIYRMSVLCYICIMYIYI